MRQYCHDVVEKISEVSRSLDIILKPFGSLGGKIGKRFLRGPQNYPRIWMLNWKLFGLVDILRKVW